MTRNGDQSDDLEVEPRKLNFIGPLNTRHAPLQPWHHVECAFPKCDFCLKSIDTRQEDFIMGRKFNQLSLEESRKIERSPTLEHCTSYVSSIARIPPLSASPKARPIGPVD